MARSTCVIRGIPIPKSTTRRPRQTTRLLLPVDFQKIGDFRITVKENSVFSIFLFFRCCFQLASRCLQRKSKYTKLFALHQEVRQKEEGALRDCFKLSNFGNFYFQDALISIRKIRNYHELKFN